MTRRKGSGRKLATNERNDTKPEKPPRRRLLVPAREGNAGDEDEEDAKDSGLVVTSRVSDVPSHREGSGGGGHGVWDEVGSGHRGGGLLDDDEVKGDIVEGTEGDNAEELK